MLLRGKLLQYFVFCGGVLNVLQSGLGLGWPSYALPQLLSNTSTIPITDDEGSWIASIFLIGGICGSIITALTLDVFGRKIMLLVASLPGCGVWLVIAFARTTVELYIARFLAGVSDGLLTSCLPLYFAETFNQKIRGFVITNIQVAYFVGVFLANLLGAFLSMYVIAIIFSAVALGGSLCYLFIPESPHFYVIKGDVKRAKDSIELFHGGSSTDLDGSVNKIREALMKSTKGKWWELFTDATNRKFLCIIVLSRMLQQFSGFTGIIFYTQTLFRQTEDDVNPIVFVSIYYLLQISVMIVNASVVDKIGRRPLLITSTSIVVVALCIVSSYFTLQNVVGINVTDYSWCPIFGLLLYIVGFTVGLQSVLFLLVNEIFPLHVKACAVSAFTIAYSLSGTAVSKLFQYTKDEFGLHVPFTIFTLCTMCAVPFFILYIPETKRKTLEEVQSQLRSKKKTSS